jgi:ABC-type lipoprotein release transport system permease subunit
MTRVKAVAYRVGLVLRAQWRATAALALVIAIGIGVVLAFAAGAARTSTVPDRYTAAAGGDPDANVEQEGGRSRRSEVASLPGVASVDAASFVFGELAPRDGGSPLDAYVFSGKADAVGRKLAAGRAPDPKVRGEFVASGNFLKPGVAIGSKFELRVLSQADADRGGFEAMGEAGTRPSIVPAVLVGILNGPAELEPEPTPLVVFSDALLDDHDIAVATTLMTVRLRPGTNFAALRAQLDALPDGKSLRLDHSQLVGSEVRTAVDGQARGFWLLALVAAATAVVALGQLLSRSVRLSAEERPRLEAIGFSRGQLLAESLSRAAVPTLIGAGLGVALAVCLSPVFPTGFVRRMEPDPGVRIDPAVLGLGVALLFGALALWTFVVLLATGRPRREETAAPMLESVAASCPTGPLATGVRFAFTRSSRDGGPVATGLVGVLVITAILTGAVVFGSSLGRLVTDGALFGHTYDFLIGSGGEELSAERREALVADRDVTGVTYYATGQGRVGAATLGLAGMEPVKGDVAPRALTGRLPAADDEIALGRLLAHRLGVGTGSRLDIDGGRGVQRFRVAGLAVIPDIEGLDGVGQDAVVTIGGLRRLDPDARASAAVVKLREGAPAGTADRFGLNSSGERPAVIANLVRIRGVPFLLAWLVAALAVATVAHVMITSVRNRRRDVAVLRAIGADRWWITRTLHWQATVYSFVPLALGVPIGIVAGRVVFELFANSVGAVPDASFPFILLAAVLVGFVVLANVAAEVPARLARRLAPGPLLGRNNQ